MGKAKAQDNLEDVRWANLIEKIDQVRKSITGLVFMRPESMSEEVRGLLEKARNTLAKILVNLDEGMPMKPKKEYTKVVFRKWRGEGGDVLALFPEIPADIHGQFCQSYQHIGQHGSADYDHCINKTRPAAPGEYAGLMEELAKIGYALIIYDRISPAMVKARLENAKKV